MRVEKVFSSEKAGSNAIAVAALERAVKDGAKHTGEGQAFCGVVINMSLDNGLSLVVNDTTEGAVLASSLSSSPPQVTAT